MGKVQIFAEWIREYQLLLRNTQRLTSPFSPSFILFLI